MAKAKRDPDTLRSVSRELRREANRLAGKSTGGYSVDVLDRLAARANEADRWADRYLSEARAIEKAKEKP